MRWGFAVVLAACGSVTAPPHLVYPANATGNAAPLRSIVGAMTQLAFPGQILVTSHEVFITNFTNSSVQVHDAQGTGTLAPIRSLTGAATLITNTSGVTIY